MSESLRIFETIAELERWREQCRVQNLTIGFVPTMGALHGGHISLVERSRSECARTVVSIFVNPTQFNNPRDLETYPRPVAQDIELLAQHKVDAVFLPKPEEIYCDKYRFEVNEKELSQTLCGAHRPGHFAGVLTVVMKLFNIVRPQRAYFGEKDFQQLSLIRDMARAFFMDVEVVPCPTLRESDGLAKSSRNLLLTVEQRRLAPALYRVLCTANSAEAAAAQLGDMGFVVDYVEDRDGRRFAAAHLGQVRLIDNVAF